MTSRYEAYMDGTALSSLDSSIYILNIQYGGVKKNIRTSKVAGRAGARITKQETESNSVTILFEIHEYDIADRQEVCQSICKWADGSVLTVNDRTGQQLSVVCEQYPAVSAKDWTEQLSVTFTAYNPPYWQDSTVTSFSLTGTEASTTQSISGNAPETLVSVKVTASESVNALIVSSGSKIISLSNIGALAGDKIYIEYDSNNILYIRKNSTSILDKRSATSSDDISVPCGGSSSFYMAADGSVTAEFSYRGWWY